MTKDRKTKSGRSARKSDKSTNTPDHSSQNTSSSSESPPKESAQWKASTDPQASREAEKYERPVPSREFILEYLEQQGKLLSHRALCELLDLDDPELIEGLRRRLRAMERDGQLMRNRRGAYGLVGKMDLIRGRLLAHRDGFGFLVPDDGSDDLYLSPRQMRSGFDGDIVLACVSGVDQRGRREGTVVEVLEHRTQSVVGRFFEEGALCYVAPDNPRLTQDVIVPKEEAGDAKHGQFVVVNVVRQPTARQQALGEVAEVLGDHMAPGLEVEVAIRSHDLPHEWPSEVLDEMQAFAGEVPEEAKQHRVDLRELPLVTIDGEDARDFDDAVYCEPKRSGGWRLYVAIADVSHYVKPGTALDEEAHRRGNSVYFPGQVIPMLPEALSNGLCSLNPNVDRLAMVCEMSISANGRLSRYQFYEAVFRSHARLTYTQVGAYLSARASTEDDALQDTALVQRFPDILPVIDELHALYGALRGMRSERGAMDFETTETQIVFGADRKIQKIVPTERNDAHKIIEECMLCANVAAARFLEKHELPTLYRVHQGPKAEKLEQLNAYLSELSLAIPTKKKPTPADFQRVLQQVEGRPDAHLIQTIMLRSMMQATYTPENQGHFGLAYPAYAHFTSPIRRYPDLLVHRAIRRCIRSRMESNHVHRVKGAKPIKQELILPYDEAAMVALGEHTSLTERRADEATRDAVHWLKCEFMLDKVGETFDGVITSVTSFGLFIELSDIYVEGLVHISALDSDYYHFDPVHHRLSGENTGIEFRLGDPVTVVVSRVDLDSRKIDFDLVEGGVVGHRRGTDKPAKSAKKGKKNKNAKKNKKGHKVGAVKGEKGQKDKSKKVRKKKSSRPKLKPKKRTGGAGRTKKGGKKK